jgi:putative spermidine/putrescine transport system permease protein
MGAGALGAIRSVTAAPLLARGAVGRTWRMMLLAILTLSSIGPMLLLAVWSVSGAWFFPALRPRTVTLAAWRSAVSDHALISALGTSAVLAIGTAILACGVAVPFGQQLARLAGWRRYVGAAAAFLPVAAPPLALGTGLQVAALAAGLGGTVLGVLLAHLVPAVGYLSLLFLGTFTLLDARPAEAARTLGASQWQVWWRVTLPQLRQPIAEAVAIGFLISWTQFALTLVVGAGAVRTIPLEVYAYVQAGEDRMAAVGALLLILPPALALASLRWAALRTAVLPA